MWDSGTWKKLYPSQSRLRRVSWPLPLSNWRLHEPFTPQRARLADANLSARPHFGEHQYRVCRSIGSSEAQALTIIWVWPNNNGRRRLYGRHGQYVVPLFCWYGTQCILPYQFLADVNSRSRSLYAIADPSVCLSSVTLVRPTQLVEIFGNFFHHTIAQGL